MSDQAREREFDRSLERALSEGAAAEPYRVRRAGDGDRPRPLEFDESGFPVRQDNSTFFARVARLLTAG